MGSFFSLLRQLHRAAGGSLVLGLLAAPSLAHASGSPERIQQVFPHPTEPDLLTVRFGMASSGYLYSRDGGKTFRAMCSAAVDPAAQGEARIDKITRKPIASTTANTMDSAGRVMFSQYGALFSDDGTGCAWSRVGGFEGRWAFGIQADPVVAGVVWAAVSPATNDFSAPSTIELARRSADGGWETVGLIARPALGYGVHDGNMLVAHHEGKTRLYVAAFLGGENGFAQHLYVSDDEGETWRDAVLPPAQEQLALLAVDPQNADRVVGVVWREGTADALYLSENGGQTFQTYPLADPIRSVSGATLDPRGRLLIGDQGDGAGDDTRGGLLVAERVGAPLRRVAGTEYVDCIHYRALTDTLYMCSFDKLGTLDPESFALRELVTFEKVAGLLDCPGRDLLQECKAQLNSGPSWCCQGHFPWTPFCSAYDVSSAADGRRVFCGLAGREYERPGSTEGMTATH